MEKRVHPDIKFDMVLRELFTRFLISYEVVGMNGVGVEVRDVAFRTALGRKIVGNFGLI